MKTSFLRLTLLTVSLACLSLGCRTKHADHWNSKFANPTMDVKQLTPDIEVGKHIHGYGKRNVLLGFITWGDKSFAENAGATGFGEATKAKKAAAYEALTEGKADILIGAQYVVTERNYIIFKSYKAEAMGFAGNFKNVRQVKEFNTDQTETLPLAPSHATTEKAK